VSLKVTVVTSDSASRSPSESAGLLVSFIVIPIRKV